MSSDQKIYTSGYKTVLTSDQKKQFRERYSEKSMWKGLVWTGLYLASIYFFIAAAYFSFISSSSVGLRAIICFIAIVFVSRQMRALENIVHFGSHNNFSRSRKINDLATNMLAAWPVLQDVRQYREFHMAHHGDYGSHTDPCKARFESIGADSRKVSTNYQLIKMIIRWMPSYVREYYREVKSDSGQLAIFLVWHLSMCMVIGLLVSWSLALVAFATWMFVPFGRAAVSAQHRGIFQNMITNVRTAFAKPHSIIWAFWIICFCTQREMHGMRCITCTRQFLGGNREAAHRYLMKHDASYRQALHRDNLIQDITNLPAPKASAEFVVATT